MKRRACCSGGPNKCTMPVHVLLSVFSGLLGIVVVFVTTTVVAATTDFSKAIDLRELGARIYGVPSEESGRDVELWARKQLPGNAEEQGHYFEGDILYPNAMSRNGMTAESYRWPNGEVPVEIAKTFSRYPLCLFIWFLFRDLGLDNPSSLLLAWEWGVT